MPLALLVALLALQEPILVGMEGPAESFSVDEENLGFRLALTEANATGGIHGRPLVVKSYPRGAEDPVGDALRNVKRLVEDDGVFLLLNFGGPASIEIAPYAMEKKVPYLFPHTALVSSDGKRYVFTSFPRYEGESLVMLRYLAETRGLERIAVVHDPNVYGQYFVDRARELAPELGFTFAGEVPLVGRRPESALDEVRALRALEPDAVVMALYPAQAKKVMEAKAELGWTAVRMVSSGPLTDEQYLDVEGGASDGTLGFCHYHDPAHDESPGTEAYRRLMEEHHPGHPLNRYSLYGYVFGKLVVEGLTRAGAELGRESFVDAMESIRGWESGGVLPEVSFSPSDHHAQDAGFICELEGGRFRALTGWIAP